MPGRDPGDAGAAPAHPPNTSHRPSSEARVCKTRRGGCKSRVRLHMEGPADGRRQRGANASSDESLAGSTPAPSAMKGAGITRAIRVASSNSRTPACKREIRVRIPVDPPSGPVVYWLGRLSLTQAERVRFPSGSPDSALWRSSKRSGLIRRQSKVQVLPASPAASSSNGQDSCPSNRERGFDSRRGCHCRSSSNG
jgi:hypothetical protein